MSGPTESAVTVSESGNGPYGQIVTIGRHVLGSDESLAVGGHDTGPSPYEFLMAGLGACTAMTVRMYAGRQAWPLEKVSVALSHAKIPAPDGSGGRVDEFRRTITLSGQLTDEQRARLLDIATRCPVSQTLSRASKIVTSLADADASTA